MTHPCVMDNNCVKYYPNKKLQLHVVSYGPEKDHGYVCYVTLSQGLDTAFVHGQQLRVMSSRCNKIEKSSGPDTEFPYMCSVTLVLEI